MARIVDLATYERTSWPQMSGDKPRKRTRANGEGTWFKRTRKLPSGREVTDFVFTASIGYDENGRLKRRSFCGPTKNAVREKIERAKNRGGGSLRAAAALTVKDYLEEWLAGVERSRSGLTARSYGYRIRRFAIPNIGKRKLDDLDQPHVAKLYADLMAQGVSADNVRKLHKALRRAFNVAIGKGVLRHNPTAFVELPKHRTAERSSYDPAEVKRFLTACAGDRLEAMWHLAVFASMRPGELFALRRDDVDLDELVVDVRHSLEDDGGKLAVVDAKADSARRIPISPATADLLRRHFAALDREKHGSPYAFPTIRGKLLRSNTVNRRLKEIVAGAGLDPITLYNLRHTGISLFGEAGIHISVAQHIAGHANSEITLDVYSHSSPAMHRDAIARVEQLVAEAKDERVA